MKRSNIFQIIYGCSFCFLLAVLFGCSEKYSNFDITEKPFVDKTSIELFVGEQAGSRGQIQLSYSPSNRNYTWSSQAPDVASVDQTGLVTAHNEGYTIITVASENDQTDVNVRVSQFVPLVTFYLDRVEHSGVVQDLFLINVTPEPANATEVNVTWSSSNEEVARVYSNGLVKILKVGESVVSATCLGITKSVNVFSKLKFQITSANIPDYANVAGTAGSGPPWDLIGLSSQSTSYPLTNLFDGNPASFWHGSYSGVVSNFPHWFILDMKATITITDLMMQKRQEAAGQNFRSCNGFYIYSCPDVSVDQSDPDDGYPWVFEGEFTFDYLTNAEQWYKIPNIEGRYFRIYFDTQHREPSAANNYIQLAEFAIFGYE